MYEKGIMHEIYYELGQTNTESYEYNYLSLV